MNSFSLQYVNKKKGVQKIQGIVAKFQKNFQRE